MPITSRNGFMMTGYELVVWVPTPSLFDAYWYGVGDVVSVELEDTGNAQRYRYTVDYGLDAYRCQYQRDRFLSGLYHAEVREYSSVERYYCPDCEHEVSLCTGGEYFVRDFSRDAVKECDPSFPHCGCGTAVEVLAEN